MHSKPNAATTVEPPLEFNFVEVANTVMVEPTLFDARFDLRADEHHTFTRDKLLYQLRAYVLASDENEHSQGVSWTEHRKPWWLPRFMWKRVPTEKCNVELTHYGRNLYPHPHPEHIAGPPTRKHRVERFLSPNSTTGSFDARQDQGGDLRRPS